MSHEIHRRDFLITAMVALNGVTQRTAKLEGRAIATGLDEGELFWLGEVNKTQPTNRDNVRIKVAGDQKTGFALVSHQVRPNGRIPTHLHGGEDELMVVLSGTGTAILGDATPIPIGPGSVLYVPARTWHGCVNGDSVNPLTLISQYSPGGFEGFYRSIGVRSEKEAPPRLTPQEIDTLSEKFGIKFQPGELRADEV